MSIFRLLFSRSSTPPHTTSSGVPPAIAPLLFASSSNPPRTNPRKNQHLKHPPRPKNTANSRRENSQYNSHSRRHAHDTLLSAGNFVCFPSQQLTRPKRAQWTQSAKLGSIHVVAPQFRRTINRVAPGSSREERRQLGITFLCFNLLIICFVLCLLMFAVAVVAIGSRFDRSRIRTANRTF